MENCLLYLCSFIPIVKKLVFLLVNDGCSIVHSWVVVILPNLFDRMGGLSLNHRHLHYLPQLPGAGVVESHPEPDSSQTNHHIIILSQHHKKSRSLYLSSVLFRIIPFYIVSASIFILLSSTNSRILACLDTSPTNFLRLYSTKR